jgi:acyl carrier protein
MVATLNRAALVGVILAQARAVLDNPELLSDDNFFDAGGDSILAVDMADRLSEMIGSEVPVAFVYTFPTAADMAEVVAEEYGEPDGPTALR